LYLKIKLIQKYLRIELNILGAKKFSENIKHAERNKNEPPK
jgi:hypothetical protein